MEPGNKRIEEHDFRVLVRCYHGLKFINRLRTRWMQAIYNHKKIIYVPSNNLLIENVEVNMAHPVKT